MKKQYLECGKIVSTHGVRGEVKVTHWCDSPEYLLDFKTLYFDKGTKPVTVERARLNKNMVLLKLSGVDDMDAAANLRGKILYIDRNDAPEDDGVFLQDMMGIRILDADSGADYGTLTDIIHTGANDVYEATADNGIKRLIPAIPDVIITMDTEEGRMTIRPLKGLFDDA